MKEYNKVLDAQEKLRQEEKERRVARQKQLMEKMKETVLAQQEAKGQEDEIRAARQKEEADLRALEIAVNKQEKLEAMRSETRDYLLKQMQDKTDKRQQALELKKLQVYDKHNRLSFLLEVLRSIYKWTHPYFIKLMIMI